MLRAEQKDEVIFGFYEYSGFTRYGKQVLITKTLSSNEDNKNFKEDETDQSWLAILKNRNFYQNQAIIWMAMQLKVNLSIL